MRKKTYICRRCGKKNKTKDAPLCEICKIPLDGCPDCTINRCFLCTREAYMAGRKDKKFVKYLRQKGLEAQKEAESKTLINKFLNFLKKVLTS